MKTAVVTDSTAYIPEEMRDRLHIHMMPLNVIFPMKLTGRKLISLRMSFMRK